MLDLELELYNGGGDARTFNIKDLLTSKQLDAVVRTPRVPVLAIGSNASIEQLQRKYAPDVFPCGVTSGVVIPVIQSLLYDFDVCYAPLLTSYGSCAATLHHSGGTCSQIYITYLDKEQLIRMHAA